MAVTALSCIIPTPQCLSLVGNDHFPLSSLTTIACDSALAPYGQEALRICQSFGIPATLSKTPASLQLSITPQLPPEGWSMGVRSDGIRLCGGDEAGLFYGLGALAQIIAAATMAGPKDALIECGDIKDAPRFKWRGFMLDCARHFQSVKTVKAVIKLMAAYRLNVLHWHLTDNQGWRLGTGIVPPDTSLDMLTTGSYSRDELLDIIDFAKRHFIQIVPEFDVPGHSRSLLHAFPEMACDPNDPGKEFCLGKRDTVMPFLKKIYDEIFAIFKDSKYIHFGGDEAETDHWDKCPHCQAALKERHFNNIRELENDFMVELTRYAVEKGFTPIVWGTSTPFPKDTVIQAWLDIREPLRQAANGCKTIMSVHTSYYFDYPANSSEPQETWMFALPEEGVYMADPYVIWPDTLKNMTLGPEACLWTEMIPEWRIVQKILPRLGAFAETAWSEPVRKDWHDFCKRRDCLRAAGYEDWLKA